MGHEFEAMEVGLHGAICRTSHSSEDLGAFSISEQLVVGSGGRDLTGGLS
jgi:hypothetical protein